MAPGAADKKNNVLPLWGNEKTMNLNNLILTNILSSHYFKVNLYQLKTYHEVIDEIYYHVNHLEPWEKGSRKTSGQTGMCGGVRGVGAGGIVSTAFCILYKLFTLKLTRKQVNGLISHCDSPYIRALGFMYVRFTQPPVDLWDWFDPYLDDKEELDVKAGGGQIMTIGEILRHFLTKLEWFSTLFPRIPVPIQKDIERKLSERKPSLKTGLSSTGNEHDDASAMEEAANEADDHADDKGTSGSYDRSSKLGRSSSKERKSKGDEKGSKGSSSEKADLADEIARERERQRREKERHSRSRSPQHGHHHHHHHYHHERRSRSKDRHRYRDRSRDRSRERRSHHDREYEKDKDRSSHKEHHRDRERDRERDRKEHQRSRSRSKDRHRSRKYEDQSRSSRDRHHY